MYSTRNTYFLSAPFKRNLQNRSGITKSSTLPNHHPPLWASISMKFFHSEIAKGIYSAAAEVFNLNPARNLQVN
jgi:hypothetical protein